MIRGDKQDALIVFVHLFNNLLKLIKSKNLNFNLEAHQCRIQFQGEGVKADSLGGISIQLTSNQIEEIVERKPQ